MHLNILPSRQDVCAEYHFILYSRKKPGTGNLNYVLFAAHERGKMALPEQLVETPAISQAGHLVSETYVAKTMPSILGTFDMVAIYLAAIFFIGNAALVAAMGSVVSLTYLAIGAVCFFLPSVIANAQLGSLCPHEGSLYNWTSRALGPYW